MICRSIRRAIIQYSTDPQPILTKVYIEALLADEELADQAWDAGEIDDLTVWLAQWSVAAAYLQRV